MPNTGWNGWVSFSVVPEATARRIFKLIPIKTGNWMNYNLYRIQLTPPVE
jgi:hypothetical protein